MITERLGAINREWPEDCIPPDQLDFLETSEKTTRASKAIFD